MPAKRHVNFTTHAGLSALHETVTHMPCNFIVHCTKEKIRPVRKADGRQEPS